MSASQPIALLRRCLAEAEPFDLLLPLSSSTPVGSCDGYADQKSEAREQLEPFGNLRRASS
jgi:hypothetical protein